MCFQRNVSKLIFYSLPIFIIIQFKINLIHRELGSISEDHPRLSWLSFSVCLAYLCWFILFSLNIIKQSFIQYTTSKQWPPSLGLLFGFSQQPRQWMWEFAVIWLMTSFLVLLFRIPCITHHQLLSLSSSLLFTYKHSLRSRFKISTKAFPLF